METQERRRFSIVPSFSLQSLLLRRHNSSKSPQRRDDWYKRSPRRLFQIGKRPTVNAPLAILPTELIEQVCDSLEATDISSLRLVCLHLFDKTSKAFFSAFFTTVTTDFCTKSLRRIENVSQHPHARQSVKELVIEGAKDRFGQDGDLGHDIEGEWHRSFRGVLEVPLPVEVNKFLQGTLVEGLPYCRSFTIREIYGPQSFPHDTRGPSTAYLRLTDALQLLFTYISEFRLPVKSFTLTLTGSVQDMRPLRDDSYSNPGFMEAWGNNLQELNLFTMDWWRLSQESESLLTTLIGSAKNLTSLSLSCSSKEQLLNLIHSSHPSWAPPLRYLHLKGPYIDPDWWFFKAISPTLRSLDLEYVRLKKGTWQEILPALAHLLKHLRHIRLFIVYTEFPGFNHDRYINYWWDRAEKFPPGIRWLQQGYRPLIGGIDYEGPDVVTVLESLLKVAYVRKWRGNDGEPLEIPFLSPPVEPFD